MPYVIRSYHGQEEWGSKQWIAHMNLGNDLFMSFFGGTKEEAEKNARNWYDTESKRWGKIDNTKTVSEPVEANDGWGKQAPSDWGSPSPSLPSGSEHGMVGKVWLINHAQQKRLRVNPNEVDGYLSQGFEKGGPKTAFRI